MPRAVRAIVPGVPLHITQRGVDRCPTFLAADDFAFYRWALGEACRAAGCAVHAYVLMTNHVHLLVTPADAAAPARMMCSLGRRYVRYFNHRYRRTGTLWEGRYRDAVVDSASYLFTCARYIEMNPVRAGIVGAAAEYEWSSHRHNALEAVDPLVTHHACYLALGLSDSARRAAYRALFATDVEPGVLAAIRAEQRARPRVQATPYRQAVSALMEDSGWVGNSELVTAKFVFGARQ